MWPNLPLGNTTLAASAEANITINKHNHTFIIMVLSLAIFILINVADPFSVKLRGRQKSIQTSSYIPDLVTLTLPGVS